MQQDGSGTPARSVRAKHQVDLGAAIGEQHQIAKAL